MRNITPKPIKRYELSKSESTKPTKKYPSVTVDLYALPEAKDWEVGKTYEVTLRLEMTGLSMRKSSSPDSYDMEYGNNATFNITGVEAKGKVKGTSSKESKKEEADDEEVE